MFKNFEESIAASLTKRVDDLVDKISDLKASTCYHFETIRDYVSEPLAILVNDSFASGNFPEKLKLARITPVFKKGSTFDKDNNSGALPREARAAEHHG